MNKSIFFSGTHGVGKTTTIRNVAKELDILIFNAVSDDHRNPCEKDVFNRQAWRLGKYFSDAVHLKDLGMRFDGPILVDRCVYDWLAYTRTFQKLGWLSKEEFKKLEDYHNALFDQTISPKNIIWFDPPYEWSKERILIRWNEEKKKWNEGDFEYLKLLREIYADIYGNNPDINVLRLKSTEIDVRANEIKDFLKRII
ncbi:MAG: deoxynucleoside kinase [Patescibacteria group bacterium]